MRTRASRFGDIGATLASQHEARKRSIASAQDCTAGAQSYGRFVVAARFLRSRLIFTLLFVVAVACTRRGGEMIRPDVGAPRDSGVVAAPGCDGTRDEDNDGIADAREGAADDDADGLPNRLDTDSDGDGISDGDERGPLGPCFPASTDNDPLPDFRDTDSDNDGVSDGVELERGTDRTRADTDDDGAPDLVELAAGTDPTDFASRIPDTDFYVVLPFNGAPVTRALKFGTKILIADVFFLVDTTSSMSGVRTTIVNRLTSAIIPGVKRAITNVQFGIGGFDDYPINSHGSGADRPFYMLRAIGDADEDLGAWENRMTGAFLGKIGGSPNGKSDLYDAVQALPLHSGGDVPESTGPALFATATGEGLTWSGGSIPAQSCPIIPDEIGTRRGYPCFRPGALPIIVVFGDAAWHNGKTMRDRYSFTAPVYQDVIDELNDIGARVISITNSAVPADYRTVAQDTGAVRSSGEALTFQISSSGTGVDTAIVDAIASLVSAVPQDVTTRRANEPGNPDDADATQFVKSVVPVDGERDGARGPMSGVTYAEKNETSFFSVMPGTKVEFQVDFQNTTRPGAPDTQVFRARIVVMGNGSAELDSRRVFVVVPPENAIIVL